MMEATSSLLALITICVGKTTYLAIITDELEHLFCSNSYWEVTPVSDHEFKAVFPDPISLRYATHSAEITLALNNLTVNMKVATGDPMTVATLSMVWIQIHGLPPIARQDGVIRSMTLVDLVAGQWTENQPIAAPALLDRRRSMMSC
ncbi:hypothetical protein D1007_53966 [Hordeum vulgare]|nr:hypothetical protein D1007_53966 [Hordeum vulgare]